MKIKDCDLGQRVVFRTKTSETESVKIIGEIVEINVDDEFVFVKSEQGSGSVPCDILLGVLK